MSVLAGKILGRWGYSPVCASARAWLSSRGCRHQTAGPREPLCDGAGFFCWRAAFAVSWCASSCYQPREHRFMSAVGSLAGACEGQQSLAPPRLEEWAGSGLLSKAVTSTLMAPSTVSLGRSCSAEARSGWGVKQALRVRRGRRGETVVAVWRRVNRRLVAGYHCVRAAARVTKCMRGWMRACSVLCCPLSDIDSSSGSNYRRPTTSMGVRSCMKLHPCVPHDRVAAKPNARRSYHHPRISVTVRTSKDASAAALCVRLTLFAVPNNMLLEARGLHRAANKAA